MNTKTYLSQARYLDMRIKSKLQQVDSLNEIAELINSNPPDLYEQLIEKGYNRGGYSWNIDNV